MKLLPSCGQESKGQPHEGLYAMLTEGGSVFTGSCFSSSGPFSLSSWSHSV